MSKESTIEKYHRECLAFNRAAGYTIDETEFDITVAQTALQELYHLYEAGIASDKFQRDKDYVVRRRILSGSFETGKPNKIR